MGNDRDKLEDSVLRLTYNDLHLLVQLLKNPPEPNEELKAAFSKISDLCEVAENGEEIYNVSDRLIKNPREKE